MKEEYHTIEYHNDLTKKIFKDRIEYYDDIDQYHRINGAAIEFYDGDKYWFIHGIEYTEQEFKLHIRSTRIKKLIHQQKLLSNYSLCESPTE